MIEGLTQVHRGAKGLAVQNRPLACGYYKLLITVYTKFVEVQVLVSGFLNS